MFAVFVPRQLHHCCSTQPADKVKIDINTNPNFSNARQLTGTAMLRPAASPWTCWVRGSSAVTARCRTPIAARWININAASSSSEPSLEPQVNVDAASVPAASPGMGTRTHRHTQHPPSTSNHRRDTRNGKEKGNRLMLDQTPASKSSAHPSLSSPSPSRRPRRSIPAAAPSSASAANRRTHCRPSPSSSPFGVHPSASRSSTRRYHRQAPLQRSSPPSRPYRASSR